MAVSAKHRLPSRLRAAVIGCGNIGSRRSENKKMPGVLSHAEAYRACEDTQLVAFADANQDALERAGNLWNVKQLYRDPATLFRTEHLDMVSICTPDATHAEVLRLAIDAGIPAVLCEKPLGMTHQEASSLAAQAEARGIVLAVNYQRRYDPMHRRVREAIQAGEIGQVRHVSAWYTKGIVHNGTHLLDTLRFLCGEIVRAEGLNPRPDPSGDSTPDAVLTFAGGFTGFVHGCSAEAFAVFEIDVIGSHGRVRLVDEGHVLEFYVMGDSRYYPGYRQLVRAPFEPSEGLRDPLLHPVEDTVRALRTGARPACTAADAVRALELAQEIAHTAATRPHPPTGGGVTQKGIAWPS
ncbi:MAG: Gfo/Idh/MocA family oxidoreductase [Dehalococcoidia bacterium]|nr:Gfo/Idh/MocA family oxidoreductase [Dehalococcoidia bacterium]